MKPIRIRVMILILLIPSLLFAGCSASSQITSTPLTEGRCGDGFCNTRRELEHLPGGLPGFQFQRDDPDHNHHVGRDRGYRSDDRLATAGTLPGRGGRGRGDTTHLQRCGRIFQPIRTWLHLASSRSLFYGLERQMSRPARRAAANSTQGGGNPSRCFGM